MSNPAKEQAVEPVPSGDQNGEPPKTAKQLEKDAKKQAKLDKLKQKQEKQAQQDQKDKPQVPVLLALIRHA